MTLIKFAILTVSDSCAKGEKVDESGPNLKTLINHMNMKGILKGEVLHTAIVEDVETLIMSHLINWSEENKVNVILTTGGTGVSIRDVTPEATKKIIEKETPGLYLAMLIESLKVTPMAMLSRGVCGIRNKTLIINLPGSSKAATECFSAVAPTITHAVDLILDNRAEIKSTHNIVEHNITTCLHDKSCTIPLSIEKVAMRPRESPYPMISVKEAKTIISTALKLEREAEVINVNDAYGRILSEDIYSSYDLPPFRASIKDGYAVLASDGKGCRTVLCGLKAGTMSVTSLKPGTCARVNTGAAIPDEATAVVQVEDTKLILVCPETMEEQKIEILTEPKDGQDIRPIGCDIKKGSLILNSYTRIGVAEMGLLASCGCKDVTVIKLPSVGVISTGDELQETGESLKPGHVYDSNRITLITLLKENGFNPLDFGIIIDDPTVIVHRITKAIEEVDVLVTTGSVSMGDRDMLKPILQENFEANIHFGRVNMKPGKPTTFATCMYRGKKKYFLCLPGNPVSAFVTAHLFLLPLLNDMHGNLTEPVVVQAKLMSSYNLDSRPEYVRAILKWTYDEILPKAYFMQNQISSKLLNCKNANALLMLPGRTEQMLNKGEFVSAMLIGFK